MMVFDSLKDFIHSLDKKEFKRYISLYIGVCLLLIVAILVRHVYLLQEYEKNMLQLNNIRREVQKVFTKFQQVEHQKNKIDALLKKEKFYIQKYFQDVLQKVGLYQKTSEKLTKQKLENGYTEESLQVNLAGLNTKDLCELLQAIEQEQRVYVKHIEITPVLSSRIINVTMSIATLIPKGE